MNPIDLPLLGAPIERADAARNRQRILEAAERLFARDGVACTSMDAIAAEARVGKGTLFRRFGDRASLALALLEASERAFQDAFIRGPAPLGP
ncbi:MAG: TetR/AcrR family transcriptional regulator, partial [Solirubrobacteraceae bacterium]